mmetsp:Transcript_28666/g.52977  ORF Transcript_28666/g.52977 Transcript_28666/m.52977 type:complete len:655 (+) Transcript_28666:127-2091(+)
MTYKLFPSLLLAASSLLAYSHRSLADAASDDKENEVKSILQRMETDVLAFRDEMERVYSARCETKTLTECAESNFNDCSSMFPSQQCAKADELIFSACRDGETCNALWDKTLSTVSIPAALAQGPLDNPNDNEVIESACYSRLAEQYMIDKYKTDEEYWAKYNVQPSWTYFGAHNGLFRRIPAIHQEECGQYDPRRRPWFVAASSGPKDVVLVIDVSGSMEDYGRMDIAKEAAITIVETLTVADRVAVVAFSSRATQIGGFRSLIRANNENKKRLIKAIKNLEANGATNFYDAFNTAFNALDKTIRSESTSGCNIAVLFMTDGRISEGPGANEVIKLVNNRTEQLSATFNRNTTLFTFSLGQQADHAATKSIACSTNGIWTPVDDFTGDLVTAMSSYYKLFALGLGEGGNEDFTAWVEPYEFTNPAGKMGTTVSAPVYDRSVKPPLFLGVVAVDSYMDTLEQVLGEDATSSTMLQRFVLLSTARCPKLGLTECELDALRFLGGGEEATCGVCNSTYTGIVPEKCPFQSDLPNNLWHNTDMEGKKYEDRACCESGGIVPSESCPPYELSGGAIAGIVIGSAFFLCMCSFFLNKKVRQLKARKQQQKQSKASANSNEPTEPEINLGASYEGMSIVMPPSAMPPSAPPINPNFDVKQ